MQVILGAGGAIGIELAKELKKYTSEVRLAGRNPFKVNPGDELVKCDLLNTEDVKNAVKGCNIAYLTAGLKYELKAWEEQWPVVMKNTIEACKENNTRLVFFDNIYMYNPEKLNPMTEETQVLPSSKKGKVREHIAKMILEEVSAGKLEALIARAADFYGPGIKNSVFNEVIIKNLKTGKKALWFCSIDYLHNFTFTPDAAKAVALLGNTGKAFGQVWHLPTAKPVSMRKWIETAAKEIGVKPKIRVVPKLMIHAMGLFNPIMKEFVEMLYQYDRDYYFDSSKFENEFNVLPQTIETGIKQVIAAD